MSYMQGYATAGTKPLIPNDLTGVLEESDISSTLVSKNVTILGRRTSVRLEPEMWNALKDISRREGCSMHEICSLIFIRKKTGTSLTAAIRVFLMLYYRAATTEDGHRRVGHGDFEVMKRRAKVADASSYNRSIQQRLMGAPQAA